MILSASLSCRDLQANGPGCRWCHIPQLLPSMTAHSHQHKSCHSVHAYLCWSSRHSVKWHVIALLIKISLRVCFVASCVTSSLSCLCSAVDYLDHVCLDIAGLLFPGCLLDNSCTAPCPVPGPVRVTSDVPSLRPALPPCSSLLRPSDVKRL